jgi:ATPase family associated with various cellular activities (AAA)
MSNGYGNYDVDSEDTTPSQEWLNDSGGESFGGPQSNGGYEPKEKGPTPEFSGKHTQWSTFDDEFYYGVGKTSNALPPSLYSLNIVDGIGLVFNKVPFNTENLLRFPDTVMSDVVDEIAAFWTKNVRFKKYGIPHRRGILLYGPAGSGKSCTTQLICEDVIKRNGIVLIYHPDLLLRGLSVLRTIQPATPVVVLMEDLDVIMQGSRSLLLNMLDGVYSKTIDRVVYLATTNFPERLERRITNSPSRFDRVVEVKLPSAEARRIYLKFLSSNKDNILLGKPDSDHEHFSFAHLKELFTSVVVFENDYDAVLSRLKEMIVKDLPDGMQLETSHKGRIGLFSNNVVKQSH